jgi:hypothetical protein
MHKQPVWIIVTVLAAALSCGLTGTAGAAEWQTYSSDDFTGPETMFLTGPMGTAFYALDDKGRYLIDGMDSSVDSLSVLTDNLYYYYLEVDCELLDSTAGELAFSGLVFNYNKQVVPGKPSYYVFYIYGDGYYGAKRVMGGESIDIVLPLTMTDQINATGPNVLAVDVQGTRFDLYINGRFVNGFTDVRIDGGGFGFYISKYSKAVFDNFSVKVERRSGGREELEQPVAAEGAGAQGSFQGYQPPVIPRDPSRPVYPWEVGVDKTGKQDGQEPTEPESEPSVEEEPAEPEPEPEPPPEPEKDPPAEPENDETQQAPPVEPPTDTPEEDRAASPANDFYQALVLDAATSSLRIAQNDGAGYVPPRVQEKPVDEAAVAPEPEPEAEAAPEPDEPTAQNGDSSEVLLVPQQQEQSTAPDSELSLFPSAPQPETEAESISKIETAAEEEPAEIEIPPLDQPQETQPAASNEDSGELSLFPVEETVPAEPVEPAEQPAAEAEESASVSFGPVLPELEGEAEPGAVAETADAGTEVAATSSEQPAVAEEVRAWIPESKPPTSPLDEIETVSIEDDFSEKLWQEAQNPNSTYRYFGAAYEINNLKAETMAISYQEADYSDMELAIDLEFVDGLGYVGYGVAARFAVVDRSVSYYGAFLSQSGEFLLLKVLDNQEYLLTDWTATNLLKANGANRIKLILIGSTISLYINDKLATTVTDSAIRSGGYALLAGPGTSARFDNLAIRAVVQSQP